MLISTRGLSFLNYAPSGSAADAGGEITDDEVAAVDAAEGDDDFGAGVDVDDDSAIDADGADDGEEPVEPPSLADVWKQHGVEGLPSDPKALQREINEMRRQAAEAARYRDYASMLIQHQQEQARQAALLAQQQPKTEEKPKAPWTVPQFDRRLIDQITTDENGNLVPKPGAMPNVVDEYRKWQSAREQALDRFLQDPNALISEMVQPVIQQHAWQIASRAIAQERQRAELKAFENANRDWAFNADGSLSTAGQMWNVHYRQALQMGMADPIAYAEAQLDAEAYRRRIQQEPPAEQADSPEEAEKKKRLALLRRNRHQSSRTGSFPKPGRKTPPQNGKNPWGALAKKLEQIPKSDFDEK